MGQLALDGIQLAAVLFVVDAAVYGLVGRLFDAGAGVAVEVLAGPPTDIRALEVNVES